MKHRRGFSVTESLALGGALILVTGLLLPVVAQGGLADVFLQARKNAQRSTCQSNLKQIALGFKQYEEDYDEKFPLINAGGKGISDLNSRSWAPPFGWADALQGYLKSNAIYQCPSETNPANNNPASFGYIDYFYNRNFNVSGGAAGKKVKVRRRVHGRWKTVTQTISVTNFSGINESAINNRFSAVLAGDGMNGNARYNRNTIEDNPRANYGNPNSAAPAKIHLGGGNYAFADGHVKWLLPDQVSGAKGAAYTFSTR